MDVAIDKGLWGTLVVEDESSEEEEEDEDEDEDGLEAGVETPSGFT